MRDFDSVRVYIQGLTPPGNVSSQPIGIPLTTFAHNPNLIDFRFRLPSFKNQLSVMGLSSGVVPPTTVGTTIFGVEISSKAPSNTSGLTSKVFSHSTLGTTFIAPIECRRVQPSTNNNSGKLSSNLEAQQVPIKTWWNQRMPCNTQAHHIVTSFNNSNIPSVENSRRIIAACGIDINDAINGVPLPDNITIPVMGYVHRGSHSPRYHNAVFQRLNAAAAVDRRNGQYNSASLCPNVRNALTRIREELQLQTFTWP